MVAACHGRATGHAVMPERRWYSRPLGAHSSAGERPLHTREVAGSIPAAPIDESAGNGVLSILRPAPSRGRESDLEPFWNRSSRLLAAKPTRGRDHRLTTASLEVTGRDGSAESNAPGMAVASACRPRFAVAGTRTLGGALPTRRSQWLLPLRRAGGQARFMLGQLAGFRPAVARGAAVCGRLLRVQRRAQRPRRRRGRLRG